LYGAAFSAFTILSATILPISSAPEDNIVQVQSSHHAPADPAESTIITELQPGNYTAIMRGVNNSRVVLVEAYDLDW
jgi:hypothetical protein